MRLLEDELGVELLRRTTHEVELTDAGRLLLERGARRCWRRPTTLWRAVAARRRRAGQRRRRVRHERGLRDRAAAARGARERAARSWRSRPTCWPSARSSPASPTARSTPASCAARRRAAGVEARCCAASRQGVLLRADHPLRGRPVAARASSRDVLLLLHPRAENPGHYDAVLGVAVSGGRSRGCSSAGVSSTSPIRRSPRAGRWRSSASRCGPACPRRSTWRPLSPPAALEVSAGARALDRRPRRPPARRRARGGRGRARLARGHAARSEAQPERSFPSRRRAPSLGACPRRIDRSKQVIERYVAALAAGDEDTIRDCFAEDATWRLDGDLPISGTWSGRDTILDEFLGHRAGATTSRARSTSR